MINRRNLLKAGAAGLLMAPMISRAGHAQQLTEQEVFHDPDAPVLGNPNGNVTVVEYFDYQCPYCKKSHADVEAVIAEDGNVRFLMKDWPVFGDTSVFASQAVLGANELGQYKIGMEALMATRGALSEGDVKRLLTAAGLDLSAVGAAVQKNEKKIADLLTRNFNQALAFNFAGTPSFVIGSTTYSGVLSKDALRDAIKQARAA